MMLRTGKWSAVVRLNHGQHRKVRRVLAVSAALVWSACGHPPVQKGVETERPYRAYRYVLVLPTEAGSGGSAAAVNRALVSKLARIGLIRLNAGVAEKLPFDDRLRVLVCAADIDVAGNEVMFRVGMRDVTGEKVWSNQLNFEKGRGFNIRGAINGILEDFERRYGTFDAQATPPLVARLLTVSETWPRQLGPASGVHTQTEHGLAAIEGTWTFSQDRLVIMRDPSNPESRFLGVFEETVTPFWRPGHIKLRLSSTQDSSEYWATFYRWDFSACETMLVVENDALRLTVDGAFPGSSYELILTRVHP